MNPVIYRIPGKTYYKAECDCIHLGKDLRKLKRPDLLNSRQPKINACPDHKAFIVERLVICLDCGIETPYPPSGSLSCRCKPCAKTEANRKQKLAYAKKHPPKNGKVVTKPKKVTSSIPQTSKEWYFPQKGDRLPIGARTITKAMRKGVACIPAKNLFEFNEFIRLGAI